MSNFFKDSAGNKYFGNVNGKFHREDGPAIEWSSGTKEWYFDGKHHRIDGPAIEDASGYKEWYVNGELHRIDGPAIEYVDGSKYWYLSGQPYDLDINKINDFLDLFGIFYE